MRGFDFSFSWKRALPITVTKQQFAKQTEIPNSKSGLERKLGAFIINFLFRRK